MKHLRAAAWLVACFLCGCLDGGSPDPIGYSSHVRDEGARVPRAEEDMLLTMRIGGNDAVDEVVPLHTAYAGGQVVQYWDFGTAGSPEPAWVFHRRNADGATEAIGHPVLIDSVPGDSGYSPVRSLYLVVVTGDYDGERITSFQALEDAIELGLVEEPMAMGTAVNWPVVLAGTVLEVADGDAPVNLVESYYRGRIVMYVPLGGDVPNVGRFAIERGMLGTPNAYVLRRQNEVDPLDEFIAQRDLNGDADMKDSNLVFSVGAGEEGYTSIWQQVEVTVPSDYLWGRSQAESDLFVMEMWGLAAKPEAVVEYAPTEMTLLNLPIRYVAP